MILNYGFGTMTATTSSEQKMLYIFIRKKKKKKKVQGTHQKRPTETLPSSIQNLSFSELYKRWALRKDLANQ